MDLLCWVRLLCLDRSLADAEPKTLRYRLCDSGVPEVSLSPQTSGSRHL